MEWQLFFQHRHCLGILPFTVKKLLLLIILINNVLLPLSLLPFFIHRNIISSWTIDEQERKKYSACHNHLPLLRYFIYHLPVPDSCFSEIIYFCCLFSLSHSNRDQFLVENIASFSRCRSTYSLVLILSFKMYAPLVWYLISVVIAGGLVLSSRLKLNFHNPQQVWLGFLTGFIWINTVYDVFLTTHLKLRLRAYCFVHYFT